MNYMTVKEINIELDEAGLKAILLLKMTSLMLNLLYSADNYVSY